MKFANDTCIFCKDQRLDYMRAISVFLAVKDARSLTAASRALGISLASVSREISSLEEHLGCTLFLRSTRSIALTEHGSLFYSRIRHIPTDVRSAELALKPSTLEPSGHVRVVAPGLIGRHLMVPILARYLKEHQKVNVDFTISDHGLDMIERGMDLVLQIGSLPDSSLISKKLGEVRMVTFAAPSYWRGQDRPSVPSDLRSHDCIVFAVDPNDATWRYRSKSNRKMTIRVNARFRANSLEAVVTAAVAGIGVARAPLWYVADHVRKARLELVLDEYEPPVSAVHAVFQESRAHVPAVRALIDLLSKSLHLG
jgi:DNA-binding transcriptional LysR family regulator